MGRLRPGVPETAADPGLECTSFDSHLKISHIAPCYYLSQSDSALFARLPCWPISTGFSSVPLYSRPLIHATPFLSSAMSLTCIPSSGWDAFTFLSLPPLSSPAQLHTPSSRKPSRTNLFCRSVLLGSSSFQPTCWFVLAALLFRKHFGGSL